MAEIPEPISQNDKVLENSSSLWPLIILVLIGAAVAVSILGNANSEPLDATVNGSLELPLALEHPPRIYTVSYRAGVFSPTNLRIHAGDTVRFKNESIFSLRIVSDLQHDSLPGFDSLGDIPQGSIFSFTFTIQGIFGYHNQRNIEETGTIIVK